MMKDKRVAIIFGAILLVVGFGFLIKMRFAHKTVFATAESSSEARLGATSASPESKSETKSDFQSGGQASQNLASSAATSAPSRNPAAISTKDQLTTNLRQPDFRFETELHEYARLKDKVFLSDSEKAQRLELLSNKSLVLSLESLLTHVPIANSDEQDQQNSAIDLLLEAVQSTSPQASTAAASQVLKSVITDNQVENTAIDVSTRQALGGVKAEIMYQWASIDPTQTAQIPGLLPGPVSQQIWKNVLNAQQQNRAESSTLAP